MERDYCEAVYLEICEKVDAVIELLSGVNDELIICHLIDLLELKIKMETGRTQKKETV